MLPPRTRLDPEGFYAVLGLDPAASPEAITAAFRRKARQVHPDVPGTGDASASSRSGGRTTCFRTGSGGKSTTRRRGKPWRMRQRHLLPSSAPGAQHTAEPGKYGTDFDGRSPYQTVWRMLRRRSASGPPSWFGSGWVRSWAFASSRPGFICVRCRRWLIPGSSRMQPRSHRFRQVRNGLTCTDQAPSAGRAPDFYVTRVLEPRCFGARTKLDSYVPFGQLPPFSTVQADASIIRVA